MADTCVRQAARPELMALKDWFNQEAEVRTGHFRTGLVLECHVWDLKQCPS